MDRSGQRKALLHKLAGPAAQALGRLPFLADTELARLAHSHPAAEPLLRQVAAERGLG